MRTRIKICGLTRREDILAANRWKPDYIGFVFAESRRQVGKEKARELKNMLRPGILAVGVFVNGDPEEEAGLFGKALLISFSFTGRRPRRISEE